MGTEDQREKRLVLLEDDIGRSLAQSQEAGELRTAPSYGKPLQLGDGYAQTPTEWRMGFKILKDAGVLPPEVELMQKIEALRQSLEDAGDETTAQAGRKKLSELRQQLALRLESLQRTGRL